MLKNRVNLCAVLVSTEVSTKGPLPNSALKGKAKSLTKLPVDNFAFSFNLPLFLIF